MFWLKIDNSAFLYISPNVWVLLLLFVLLSLLALLLSTYLASGTPRSARRFFRNRTPGLEPKRKSKVGGVVRPPMDIKKISMMRPGIDPTEFHPCRYTDFSFQKEGEGEPLPDNTPLQVGKWYQLEVALRRKPTGIPTEDSEKRRPIKEPKTDQDITIWVALESEITDFKIEENVQTITLQAKRDSQENALFRVQPQRQSESKANRAQIRARLYYEFNLLEVDTLLVEVVGPYEDTTKSRLGLEKVKSFRQERLQRDYLDLHNVKPRRMHIDVTRRGDGDYFFNFTFYNSEEQRVEFTAPARLSPEYLEDAVLTVRDILRNLTMSKAFVSNIEGDKYDSEFADGLRQLARAGRGLWTKLFRLDADSSLYKVGEWLEGHPLEENSLIQVSVDKDAANLVFPWCLVYDREPVEFGFPDIWGFWGSRYCVEHQLPKKIRSTDMPIQVSDTLKIAFMLWQEFENAAEQKALMKRLVAQSHGRLKVSPPVIDTATAYKMLKSAGSHILYFYTHGYTRPRTAGMEKGLDLGRFKEWFETLREDDSRTRPLKVLYDVINNNGFDSTDSWIELSRGRLKLMDMYDKIQSLSPSPVVILNMCESAQITPSLSEESFIHFFINRGASAVIGTECPMIIEFAHPFAEQVLTELLCGEPIGIAMLKARRHFFRINNPLGLAYTLFGSGTVTYKPPTLQTNSGLEGK